MDEEMRATKACIARFERGEKYWIVNIEGVQECHTQARTIAQGKERIREALSLYIGDAAQKVEIDVGTVLPATVRKAVDRARSEREQVSRRCFAGSASASRASVSVRV
jgi:predicted RNase H-like HicB family nuclease